MQFHPLFFKMAALCAFYYASAQAAQFWLRSRLARLRAAEPSLSTHNHPVNLLRMRLVLSSMFVVVITFAAVALAKVPTAPASSVLGFVFSLLFLFIEILYRSIELFGVNTVLIPAHLNEADPASKATKGALVDAFTTGVIAAYFPLLVSLLLASVFFGLATVNSGGLESVVGIVFFIHAAHVLMRILEMHGGLKQLSAFNLRVYFPLTIGKYALIGVWLWTL